MRSSVNNNQINSNISRLETKIDMLETELYYINRILIDFGFPKGIATLKETIEEVLQENAEKNTPYSSKTSQEI